MDVKDISLGIDILVYQNFQYLRIAAPDMAEGDYVEIQCEGALPDDEPRIQWYFNEKVRIDLNKWKCKISWRPL